MQYYNLVRRDGRFYATCQELQANTWINAAFEITKRDYYVGRLKQVLKIGKP